MGKRVTSRSAVAKIALTGRNRGVLLIAGTGVEGEFEDAEVQFKAKS
jgi:hypothetical protein